MNLRKQLILTIFIFTTIISYAQKEKYNFSFLQIDSIFQTNSLQFKGINLYEINQLILNDCKLAEIESQINNLTWNGLATYFNFKKPEQITVYQNVTNFQIQLNQTRTILNQYLSNMDYWFYKTGLDYISRNDTINAILFIDKSLLFNKLYMPSLQLKNTILLSKNQLIEAISLITEIAPYLFENNSNYQVFQTSVFQLLKKCEDEAEKVYESGYYNESLTLYQKADSFCSTLKTFDCEVFKNGILNSKRGLYHSYLKIAKQAINTHNYSIAESFTDKALEYARLNRNEISNDTETNDIYRNILSRYIAISFKYKRNDNAKLHEKYLDKANKICLLLKIDDCSKTYISQAIAIEEENDIIAEEDTIIQKDTITKLTKVEIQKKTKKPIIVQNTLNRKNKRLTSKKKTLAKHATKNNNAEFAIYSNLIDIGNKYFSEGKYEEAYSKYITAKSMEKKATGKKNDKLENLLIKTAGIIITKPLENADFLIWANKLNEANSLYSYSLELQKKLVLENDSSINSILQTYKEKIQKKKCENIQLEINTLNDKANSYISLSDFQKAQTINDETFALIKTNIDCKLNSTETTKILTIIKPVVSYNLLRERAKEYYQVNDLMNFTNLFFQADSIYSINRLDTLKILNSNIISYLEFSNNEKANLFSLEYFLNKNKYDYGFQILNLLKNKQFESAKSKDYQQKLATILFLKEKTEISTLKEKFPFLKDEKWYKYFYNEYKILLLK
jgi:hypothetical protein